MRFNPNLKLVMHDRFRTFIEGNKIVPINVEISPFGSCNAKCPWCFYLDTHKPVKLDLNKLGDVIKDMNDMGIKAITWTGGGEPTLHPQFKELTIITNSLGLKQGLITNAILPAKYDPSLFEWIRCSLTPIDFNEENFKILRQCKTLGICINDTGDDKLIENMLEFGTKVGVDYVQVRPALNLNGYTTSIRVPKLKHKLLEVTKYKYKDSAIKHPYSKCYGFNFVPFIWENGDVDTCAYMRGIKEHNLGNIYKDSFYDIINKAPEYVKVKKSCQICCKNHEINKTINNAIKLKEIDFV